MLRNIYQFAPSGTTTVNFTAQYVTYFGAGIVGKQIFVRLYAVNIASGSITQGSYLGAIVT
jgi:hypothetical protein